MRTDLAYEVVDMRTTPTTAGSLAFVQTIPGGIQLWDIGGHAHDLLYDDDIAGTFHDDEATGTIEVMTTEGRVVLNALTLANWRSELEPFWDTPDFQTDDEVQTYFQSKLREAQR